jgi:uncharacterized protein YjiS (DUF1127 family)
MAAIVRLLRMVTDWRRRRAARRRAQLHGFVHMSDRILADIGVRRADLHAAISGVLPVEHIARTHGGASWSARIHRLRPDVSHQCAACAANDDLSAAA